MKFAPTLMLCLAGTPCLANTSSDTLSTPERFDLTQLQEELDCTRDGTGSTPKVTTVTFDDGSFLHSVKGLSIDPFYNGENIPCDDGLWKIEPKATHDILIFNGSVIGLTLRLAVMPPPDSRGTFPFFTCILEPQSSLKIAGIARQRRLHVEVYDVEMHVDQLIAFDYDFDKRLRRVKDGEWLPYELHEGVTTLKLVAVAHE